MKVEGKSPQPFHIPGRHAPMPDDALLFTFYALRFTFYFTHHVSRSHELLNLILEHRVGDMHAHGFTASE